MPHLHALSARLHHRLDLPEHGDVIVAKALSEPGLHSHDISLGLGGCPPFASQRELGDLFAQARASCSRARGRSGVMVQTLPEALALLMPLAHQAHHGHIDRDRQETHLKPHLPQLPPMILNNLIKGSDRILHLPSPPPPDTSHPRIASLKSRSTAQFLRKGVLAQRSVRLCPAQQTALILVPVGPRILICPEAEA